MSGNGDLEAAPDTPMSRSLLTNNPPNHPTNPPQPHEFHPIIATMHEQELGKTALTLALLIAVAIFFQKSAVELGFGLHFVLILLAIGSAAIWNGIMLRKTFPRAASLAEQAGIALVFLAFNVLLQASVAPKGFVWFPVLCFGFYMIPFVIAALPHEAAA